MCNGDETLAIVEPTGDTIAVLEAHRNVLHKETGIMEGQVVNTPTLKKLLIPEKSVSSPQTACHRHENVLLLISICMIKKQ